MPETPPTCRIHEKYGLIKCQNPSLPGDADGFCILHSQDKGKNPDDFKAALQARWEQEDQESYDFGGVFFPGSFDRKEFFGSREFNKPADFSGATFTKRANFSGARFTEGANFSRARFTAQAKFSGARFTEEANFYGARFMAGADFSKASFTGQAVFSEARFMGWAEFSSATFKERAYFFGAIFTKWARFPDATFAEGADFSWATFTDEADWCRASIGGQVVFREINHRDKVERAPPFIGDFRVLEFHDRGGLRFQDVSLAHCTFTGTDLRRPEFHHVTWGSLGGRKIIYDEVKLRGAEKKTPWYRDWFWSWVSGHLPLGTFALEIGRATDSTGRARIGVYLSEELAPPKPPWGDRYGEVERLYRNLQENYKQAGDYKNLGDFHYGEMEMHRRASKWRWFPFYWYNLYWFLSGYGERPCRALGWLAGFLLALPLLVWGVGLDSVTGGTAPGFLETFTYIFEKATFQRPPLLANLNFLGSFISNLSLLIIPGQAALFLLALRNRLGRRR
jgi:uncharacterized protein YjbI with pentapeptide repeats